LNITVEDPDGGTMDVYIGWRRHDYYHSGEWENKSFTDVGNRTYNFIPPTDSNDWLWGNTTYTWCVNATDLLGSDSWVNETYRYTTGGVVDTASIMILE